MLVGVSYAQKNTNCFLGNGPAVSTPGLGYPLLLCLGKSLVVILDYVQTAGPLRSGALFTRQRSRTRPPAGEGPGAPRVPGEAGAQPEQPKAPDLPWEVRTPAESRTPHGVPDPLNSKPDPSLKEGIDTPPRGGPEPSRVYKHRHVYKAAWSPY